MEYFEYKPKGTCSRLMKFEIEGDTIQSLKVVGGCVGNLKGIGALVQGMKIDDVIRTLQGIECTPKKTSCPDQIAKALMAYKNKKQ